ncbi:MAG: hypothetical protein ACEQSR_10660 [Candidatus Methylacidiphilales bacterium]
MNINKLAYFLLVITFVITACEKDEPTIKLPPRGNTSFIVVDSLGKDFDKQAFFNLKDSQITLVNINSWDLSFEASPFGYNITINGGMDMYAARINSRKFIKSNKPDTFNYKWDAPCGCYDSLAIKNWIDNDDKIYVLDRGGYYKTDRYYQIRFISVSPYDYKFEYATLDNPSAVTSVILKKDPTKLNVYYSFTTPTTYINFEPKKENWDFCFLKYRYVFYENNPIVKYVVRGIFINSSKVDVAVDSVANFENITPSFTENCQYSNLRDVMGYDWKIYNFTSGQYVARTKVNYIIRNWHTHEKYKLRFLDFNNNGIKGTPKFEYLIMK